jgi:hypothetical protein
MRRTRTTSILATLAAVTLIAAPTAAVARTSDPALAMLHGVDAIDASDVWAVGATDIDSQQEQTLVENFDGSQWTQVPSPNAPGSLINELYGVSAVAADDVWAVGDFADGTGTHPLIEHWDGSTWTIVHARGMGRQTYLTAVSAVTADDVWASGLAYRPKGGVPVAEHWDGTRWRLTSPARVPGSADDSFGGVVATGPDDAMAVGSVRYRSGSSTTLGERWDKTGWSRTEMPKRPGGELTSATSVAPHSVWTAGNWDDSSDVIATLVEHWNGTGWKQVASPDVKGAAINDLDSIDARTNRDIWAVGDTATAPDYVDVALVEHYDGTSWTIVPAAPTGPAAVLQGVSADRANDAWDVGYTDDGGDFVPLIQHWDGHHWKAFSLS